MQIQIQKLTKKLLKKPPKKPPKNSNKWRCIYETNLQIPRALISVHSAIWSSPDGYDIVRARILDVSGPFGMTWRRPVWHWKPVCPDRWRASHWLSSRSPSAVSRGGHFGCLRAFICVCLFICRWRHGQWYREGWEVRWPRASTWHLYWRWVSNLKKIVFKDNNGRQIKELAQGIRPNREFCHCQTEPGEHHWPWPRGY